MYTNVITLIDRCYLPLRASNSRFDCLVARWNLTRSSRRQIFPARSILLFPVLPLGERYWYFQVLSKRFRLHRSLYNRNVRLGSANSPHASRNRCTHAGCFRKCRHQRSARKRIQKEDTKASTVVAGF